MKRSAITGWLVASDACAAAGGFALAYLIRFELTGSSAHTVGPYVLALPAVLILWPLLFAVQGMYRPSRGRGRVDEALGVAAAATVTTLAVFGADAYYRLYHQATLAVEDRFQYSRVFMGVFLALDILLTTAGRAAVRRQVATRRRQGLHARKMMVIGAGELGQTATAAIQRNPQYGYHVVAFLDDDPALKGKQVMDLPVVGATSDILLRVREDGIEEILVALPWTAHDEILRILEESAREGLNVKLVPDLLQYVAIRAGFEDIDGIPLLNLSDAPLSLFDRFLKRSLDTILAAGALFALSPVFGLIALAVRRSSPGPILFRQERMGLDGRAFMMLKFRTMAVDAEAATGPVFATDDDPRATRVGQFLRGTSLDELPQLWNVLRGDMSLVGPRPERPSFVDQFKESVPHYMQRHRMKSGMTGWAQIHGWRGRTSIRKRIEHDLYYLRNWSVRLDLEILCLTVLRGIPWRGRTN